MTGQRARALWRSPVGRVATVVAVAAAVAVVAAAVGEPADRGRDAIAPLRLPPSTLVVSLDVLVGAFLAAAALLGLALAWAVLTARPGPRRPWARERAIVVAVLMAAAALAYVWLLDGTDLGERLAGLAERWAATEQMESPRAPAGEGGQVAVGLRRGAAAAGALVVLAVAVAWWWWQREPRDRAAGADREDRVAGLTEAVGAALDDIDGEPDPRAAILRCYARLDAALAAAGCARQPAETAREHQRRAAVALGPGAEAAARLVDRFERARYDAAPVTDADRRDAVAALRQARASLADDARRAGAAGQAGAATSPAGPPERGRRP